jgi:hypothetical protein
MVIQPKLAEARPKRSANPAFARLSMIQVGLYYHFAGDCLMTHADYVTQIYNHLPAVAQQEVMDFMLFLQQRYGATPFLPGKKAGEKSNHSIRDNPAFGMWADLRGDSRELLEQIRQTHWKSS